MANTVSYWKNKIGDYYIAIPDVQSLYGITAEAAVLGFDSNFSKVSVESLLFYAVAYALFVFESVLDVFRAEIQTQVDAAFVANKAWWHAQALAYQKGYDLILNPKTFKYEYTSIDTNAQIVKKVAVREVVAMDGVCKVKLFLATKTDGTIAALGATDLGVFTQYYAEKIKPTGVLVDVISDAADTVDFALTINYNPLILSADGVLLKNGTKPVELAIINFIDTLNDANFGGKLNTTKLIDAIQAVDGVVDVRITELKVNDEVAAETWVTLESTNGWFQLADMTDRITYQPQGEL